MLVYSSTLQIEPKEIWNIWFAFSRMTKNNENNKTEFDQNKKHKAEIRNNISKNQIQLRLLIWFNSCLLFFFYLRMLCLFLHCFLCPWNSLLKHNTIIRNVHVSLVLIINHYEWKKRLSCISVLLSFNYSINFRIDQFFSWKLVCLYLLWLFRVIRVDRKKGSVIFYSRCTRN